MSFEDIWGEHDRSDYDDDDDDDCGVDDQEDDEFNETPF